MTNSVLCEVRIKEIILFGDPLGTEGEFSAFYKVGRREGSGFNEDQKNIRKSYNYEVFGLNPQEIFFELFINKILLH